MNPAKDLQKFEQLPAKTKELSLLKDQAEKSTGPENAALNRKIRDSSGPLAQDRSAVAGVAHTGPASIRPATSRMESSPGPGLNKKRAALAKQ